MAWIDWQAAPIVTFTRPGCPYCFSEEYIPNRGVASGDGSRTSRRVCAQCSQPYAVISIPPDSGSLDITPGYDAREGAK